MQVGFEAALWGWAVVLVAWAAGRFAELIAIHRRERIPTLAIQAGANAAFHLVTIAIVFALMTAHAAIGPDDDAELFLAYIIAAWGARIGLDCFVRYRLAALARAAAEGRDLAPVHPIPRPRLEVVGDPPADARFDH